jgi:hypothetical protein
MPDQLEVTRSSRKGESNRAEAVSKLKSDLKALSSPKAGGVSGTCLMDVSERLDRLHASVEKASFVIDPSLAHKVHDIVVKLLTNPTIGRGATIKLTQTSVDTTRRLLTTVTRALAVSVKFRERMSKALVEGFVKPFSNTVYNACKWPIRPKPARTP